MESADDTLRPDELLAQLGWVRALARRLVADPDVTDDVLQEVCLLALQRVPSDARAGPRLRAWLAAVTRNLASHAARSELRRTRREQAAARPEALPSTDDIAAHREALRRLVDAVTSLDEPYYSVVVARYLDGRPVAEIAALGGATNAAVRQQLSRARQQLRSRLQSLRPEHRRGWLPVALPLAAPTALKSAPARSFLSHVGGSLVARTVPAVATAIGLGLLITGSVLFLRSDGSADGPAPAAIHVAQGAPEPARAVLPLLPAQEQAAPALLQEAPRTAAVVAPAAPSADRLALSPVPAEKAWDGLIKAADDLAFGTITQQGLVDLSFDLLSQLPRDATPTIANGFATYDLLDSPGRGKVQLSVNLGGTMDPTRAGAFTIQAMLDTKPGAYTGNSEDHASSTKLDIAVGTDDRDVLQGISAVSQNMLGGSQALWTQMHGAASKVPVGGTFYLAADKSTWRPIHVEASGTADKVGFLFTTGDPVEKPGNLAEPRTQLLNDVLADRRRSMPR